MDSIITTHLLRDKIAGLFHVDYGQATARKEHYAMKSCASYYGIAPYRFFGGNYKTNRGGKSAKDYTIWGRNLYLITCAVMFFGNRFLPKDKYIFYLGGTAENSPFYDATDAFIRKTNDVLTS